MLPARVEEPARVMRRALAFYAVHIAFIAFACAYLFACTSIIRAGL